MFEYADVDAEDVDVDIEDYRVDSTPLLLTAASDTSPSHALQVSI